AAEARRRVESAAPAAVPAMLAPAAASPAAPATGTGEALRQGQWTAQIACPAFGQFPERAVAMPLGRDGDDVLLEHGAAGAPGSITLRGRFIADGTLVFKGAGIAGRLGGGKPYPAGFRLKPLGDRFEGAGRL